MSTYGDSHVELTREQVYEDVWASPIAKLAAKYGMSGAGLAKLCRRHQIPVPPRGYWAKVHAGRRVRKVPLPQARDTRLERVRVLRPDLGHDERQRHDALTAEDDVAALLALDDKCGPFQVPERLMRRHPVTANSLARLEAFRDGRIDHHRLPSPGYGWASVGVSDECTLRAALLLEGLVQGLEARGCLITIDGVHPPAFTLLGSRYHILLRESRRQAENPLWGDSPRQPRWVDEFSGKLEIRMRDTNGLVVRFCRDRDGGPAGSKLQRGFRRLVVRSAEVRARKREAERALREAEEARQQEQERREAERRAAVARRNLVRQARRWERSRLLRAYAADLRERFVTRVGPISAGSDAERRLAWVESVADELDPVLQFLADAAPAAPQAPPPSRP